jgi:hypothetical protein
MTPPIFAGSQGAPMTPGPEMQALRRGLDPVSCTRGILIAVEPREDLELQRRADGRSQSESGGSLATRGPVLRSILRRWTIGLALAIESSLACVIALLIFSRQDWIVPVVILLLAACSLIAAFLVIFGHSHRTFVGTVLVRIAAASNVALAIWLVVTPLTTLPHPIGYLLFAWLLAAAAIAISAGLILESKRFATR